MRELFVCSCALLCAVSVSLGLACAEDAPAEATGTLAVLVLDPDGARLGNAVVEVGERSPEPNHHEMRPPYNWKEFEDFLFDT